ncbi:Hypothetical predicted protein, partial [Olea europaea subsp. europaea]
MVGGDFNGRIGNQNCLIEELAEELGILAQRHSLDVKEDLLLEFMEDYGLLVLNGRVCDDTP